MRVLVLSDTHIPDFAERLPPALDPLLARTELILHAGDVTSPVVLDELARHAPVLVALGNNDTSDVAAWGAHPRIVTEAAGVPIGMVHDSGRREGRGRRLRRAFPGCELIVFGHSHIPLDYEEEGVRFLNPGSPTWKRRQPEPTVATVAISRRGIRTEIVAL